MWQRAAKELQEIFFKDEIELYQNQIIVNDIGEALESPQLIGKYRCNVQHSAAVLESTAGGQSLPQGARITLDKSVPLNVAHTYKVKLVSKTADYGDELWRVDSWVEKHIAVVLIASREVNV